MTVAGDVAAGWVGALDAAGVDIEPCERAGVVRRCEVHVFDFGADEPFDCHWWVRVRVAERRHAGVADGPPPQRRQRVPEPPAGGPPTAGQETVPPTGRLGTAPM
jgi:hypothetical protein